jgi:hypothetical protein
MSFPTRKLNAGSPAKRISDGSDFPLSVHNFEKSTPGKYSRRTLISQLLPFEEPRVANETRSNKIDAMLLHSSPCSKNSFCIYLPKVGR